MKKVILTLALVSGLGVAGLAHAQSATTAPSSPSATPYATAGSSGTSSTSSAATPASSPAQSAQSNKMKVCAQQYHEQNIPKDQYRAFMSNCLKKNPSATGTTPAAAPATPATTQPSSGVTKTSTSAPTQQDKMKACNASAKSQSLTGDARKTFMKSCLGGSSSTGGNTTNGSN